MVVYYEKYCNKRECTTTGIYDNTGESHRHYTNESKGIQAKERLLYDSIYMNDQPDKTNPSDINQISICLGWGVGWGGRGKRWAEKRETLTRTSKELEMCSVFTGWWLHGSGT